MKKIFFLIILLTAAPSLIFPQEEVNIVPYLKQIEAGEAAGVMSELTSLKVKYPFSVNLLFLEAVITEDARESVNIFDRIVKEHPENNYADAALFRIYSYYYALGLYETASSYRKKLDADYPSSPYNKLTRAAPESVKETEKVEKPVEQDRVVRPVKKEFRYTIQAGAFGKPENAAALKRDFEEAGYTSWIKDKLAGGTLFHVVFVGEFTSEEEAEDFLTLLAGRYRVEGRIMPYGENR